MYRGGKGAQKQKQVIQNDKTPKKPTIIKTKKIKKKKNKASRQGIKTQTKKKSQRIQQRYAPKNVRRRNKVKKTAEVADDVE